MADNKYGRLFTTADVERIVEYAHRTQSGDLDGILADMDDDGVRFKWEADEPLFVLRGRDNTAEGAVRFYRDHQRPRAPQNHTEGIDKAVTAFRTYRTDNPQMMKDPD